MNVSKHLLPFIALACCASAARAQRITSADSVLLFRTDANATSTNGSVVKTKGKVTQIALRPDGSADVYVFKQHAGILKTTAKVKGLPSGLAVIPGLTQLRFAPGQGIVPVRDELFNLNSGLKQPIGYQLLDIDASRPKGAEPEVITDDRQGADYNKALRENPVAMGYRGDTRNYYVYSSGDRSALTLTTQQEAYDPYSASSRLQTPQSRKIMTLSAKAVPFTAAPLAYANALAGMAVAFRPDDGAFLALDSTGRTTHTEIVPELKGLRPLAASPVYETVSGGMLDIAEAMRQVGTDYVLGLTSSDKGYKESGYWVARVANDGRVLFKHPFEAKMEDYIPNGSVQVASNSDECIVQVELRRSMLKYTTIRIKANSGGIVYNRTTTADELKAMPIARGKEDGAVPGNTPAKT